MGFFDSPREREAPGLFKGQMGSYDDVLKQIEGLKSSYSGIGNAGDVRKKFGLSAITPGGIKKQVGDIYDPLRRNLATRRARALSSAASRMGNTKSVMPESYFAPIESEFGSAFGNLESAAGAAELQEQGRMTEQERFIASLLNDVLGRQDSFGQNKVGLRLQGLGGKDAATGNYLKSLSDASTFDDILALGGVVSDFF